MNEDKQQNTEENHQEEEQEQLVEEYKHSQQIVKQKYVWPAHARQQQPINFPLAPSTCCWYFFRCLNLKAHPVLPSKQIFLVWLQLCISFWESSPMHPNLLPGPLFFWQSIMAKFAGNI